VLNPDRTFRVTTPSRSTDGERPYIDRFAYAGTITGSCGRFVLDGINTLRRVPNALVLFSRSDERVRSQGSDDWI